jgi:YbbR domain-containing protein
MNWLRTTALRWLLAFGLSLGLWVFVSYTQNPDQRTTYEKVRVEIEGLTPGLLLVDSDGQPRTGELQVNLTVDADQETLSDLRQSDMLAFVDLSERGPGEHIVPVNVITTRAGLTRVRLTPNPQNLAFRLEQEITRTVALEIQVTGNVPFSFVAGQPSASVGGQVLSEVQVRGPQSRVERVQVVRAVADIDRLTANYNAPRPFEALGENNQIITGVRVLPVEANIRVPIQSAAGSKRVPILPEVNGIPGSGFVVSTITVSPQFVTLTGSSGPLDQVQSVRTSPIDVSNVTQTTTYTVDIVPPEGVVIQAGEPLTAAVRIEVSALQRNFSVTLPAAIQLINIPAGLLASADQSLTQITVVGNADRLATLERTQIQGFINLNGLTAGRYDLIPSFNLPAGISLAGVPPRITVTLVAQPTSTPIITPTVPTTTSVPATNTPTEPPTEAPTNLPTSAPTPAETPTPGN